MDDKDIDIIGDMLEDKGLSHSEIDDYFLEHYGVQGMKWGARRAANKSNISRLQSNGLSKKEAKRTNRAQNRVDTVRMAATGRQGKVSVLRQLNNRGIAARSLSVTTALRHPLSVKKASKLQLEKSQKTQARIANGEKKVTAALLKFQKISIKDIDFSIS